MCLESDMNYHKAVKIMATTVETAVLRPEGANIGNLKYVIKKELGLGGLTVDRFLKDMVNAGLIEVSDGSAYPIKRQ